MAGTSAWLTVPTRGDHPDLLAGIVADCGLPPDRVVVIATAPDLDLPAGVHVLHDFGAICIQRWWNEGIRHAQANGATHALVVNDDIVLTPESLPAMLDAMAGTDAVLCWAHPAWDSMTGWCWLLDLASDVRPDEQFRWFFGDNDLARQAGTRIARADAGVLHMHPTETTAASAELRALAERDQVLYRQKWR